MATAQLAVWEKEAGQWILVPQWRDDQFHLVCPVCEMSVYAVSEQSLTPDILKASTVAHIRNMHRELESKVYGE
jgi:hypothetical protein